MRDFQYSRSARVICEISNYKSPQVAGQDNAAPLFSVYAVGQQPSKESGAFISGPIQGHIGRCGEYLAELVRYIHLNPVRAKLVKGPERYLWSGHRVYMGQETLQGSGSRKPDLVGGRSISTYKSLIPPESLRRRITKIKNEKQWF